MADGAGDRLRCTAYLKKWRHGFFSPVLMTCTPVNNAVGFVERMTCNESKMNYY
jgi:hypothetical protein